MKFIKTLAHSLEGRKFFLTMLTLILSTVLIFAERIGDSIYRDILIGIVALYIGGNVTQKIFTPSQTKQQEQTNED